MIVTASRAMNIVANGEIAGRVPGLAQAHESYLAAERAAVRRLGSGCRGCKTSEPEFAPVRKSAVAAIRGLPEDQLLALKRHLSASRLVFYTPSEDGSTRKETI